MNTESTLQTRAVLWAVMAAIAVLASGTAYAEDEHGRMAMHVRLDNDVFSGSDRGYTNGFQLGFTSPTVQTFDDAVLPRGLRAIGRGLGWLQPRGFAQNTIGLTVSQAMFTPEESELNPPDPLDRPYAGLLFAGITYSGRDSYTMRSTGLDLGLVGPSSLAEQTQDFVHSLTDTDEFLGWDHQLNDEPVFRIHHQRLHKRKLGSAAGRFDAIFHYGGSIGNLTSFGNAGAELRFGGSLPDDFGTAPAPFGDANGSSRSIGSDRRPGIHGFAAFDARYVLHDITLDGNTWRDSASVDKEVYVADVALGFAAYWGGWKITVARYFRTKQFDTEPRDTRFGSITFRREFSEP